MFIECPHCFKKVLPKNNICPSCRKDINEVSQEESNMVKHKIMHKQKLPNKCFYCMDETNHYEKIIKYMGENPTYSNLKRILITIFSFIFTPFRVFFSLRKDKKIIIELPVCNSCIDKIEDCIKGVEIDDLYIEILTNKKFKELTPNLL